LHDLLTSEFDDAPHAYRLFDALLQHENYDRDFCQQLLHVVKQTGVPWEIRRLAILMLEHQILKLDSNSPDEFDFLFTQLNLKQSADAGIVSSVLKEGYSTTNVRQFTEEFRRKLERLHRLHNQIRGPRTSLNAWRDFIELARHDCKLSLARYVFTPDEVADRILDQLQVTDGVKDLDTLAPLFIEGEIQHALNLLPDFEARILRRLSEASSIYWVSESSSAEINSLVEYPLTTAVLVVKPPGSELEFEIKRAGRNAPNPLTVVFARDGYTVAPSHRLDGGDMLWMLRYEAKAAAKLALVFRFVHGIEAPIAGYVSRSTITSIPVRKRSVQLITYFTDPQVFGKGFRRMRVAMTEAVDAFTAEDNANLSHLHNLPGDLGLTAQFVGHVAPAQAILAGTSSFRLDKIARYLSGEGPRTYFTKGLAVQYSKHDAKRLADDLLEEILGVYQPPKVRYESYQSYLASAFAVAANRARADQIYLSLVQQIGKLWGTLLAMRGYSRGESFVARNVGLKSIWQDGEWKVKIVFMDHDALVIPGPQNRNFHAHGALSGMAMDERYIWGKSKPKRFATSEVGYLQTIYRVGDDICVRGEGLARRAFKQAYRKTQTQMLADPELQTLFNPLFIERLRDWDTLVKGYFQKKDSSARMAWKKKMRRTLALKGYKKRAFDAYLEIIEEHREFIQRYAFLFED
jgi:hypothetical protein